MGQKSHFNLNHFLCSENRMIVDPAFVLPFQVVNYVSFWQRSDEWARMRINDFLVLIQVEILRFLKKISGPVFFFVKWNLVIGF